MSELKKTISTIFFVPVLKIDREQLIKNGFINGYVRDIHKDHNYENVVYLLFKPKDIDSFQWFLHEEYDRTSAIVEDYDYQDFIVVVYQLPKKYADDYELIKKGRYSKVSPEFQSLFSKVKKVLKNGLHRDEISLQYRIFNKTEDLREYWESRIAVDFTDKMEVWEGWEDEKETLNIDEIKQLV